MIKCQLGMGVEAWTHPHTDTHIHFYWARIQIHKGFLFSQKTLLALFCGTFWLVFNCCCCFPAFYFVCIYVCVLLYVCVCAFTSFLWEKSRNRYEPASCLPCHAPSSNIFIFFYVSLSEGGARCSTAHCSFLAALLGAFNGCWAILGLNLDSLTAYTSAHTQSGRGSTPDHPDAPSWRMLPVVTGLRRLILSATWGSCQPACLPHCVRACVCVLFVCVWVCTPQRRLRSSPESHLKLCISRISRASSSIRKSFDSFTSPSSSPALEILSNLVHATFITLMAYHLGPPVPLALRLLTVAWGFVIRYYCCCYCCFCYSCHCSAD